MAVLSLQLTVAARWFLHPLVRHLGAAMQFTVVGGGIASWLTCFFPAYRCAWFSLGVACVAGEKGN
jgi:hypothetical protein